MVAARPLQNAAPSTSRQMSGSVRWPTHSAKQTALTRYPNYGPMHTHTGAVLGNLQKVKWVQVGLFG